jgi:hypothetical protein
MICDTEASGGGTTVDVKTATDVASNIVTSVAVLVGGVWAYFKFIKGRTFAHRAELDVSPSLETSADSLYLSVTITLKNTGLSKLPLNDNMKVTRLFGLTHVANGAVSAAKWERVLTVPILDQHAWLEAQETVTDTVVYSLYGTTDGKGARHSAYQVEALVGARRRLITRRGTRWQARAVVFLPPSNSTKQGGVLVQSTRTRALMKRIAELGKERPS